MNLLSKINKKISTFSKMIDENSSDSDISFNEKDISKTNFTDYENKIDQKEANRREKNKVNNRNYRQKKKIKAEVAFEDSKNLEEPFLNLNDLNESINFLLIN